MTLIVKSDTIPVHLKPSIIERYRFENDPRAYLKVIKEKIPYNCKTYKGDELIQCGCVQDKKTDWYERWKKTPYGRTRDCLDCSNTGWKNFGWGRGIPNLWWNDVKDEVRYKFRNKYIWVKDKSKATYLNLQKEHLSVWSDLLNEARQDYWQAWNYNRITNDNEIW